MEAPICVSKVLPVLHCLYGPGRPDLDPNKVLIFFAYIYALILLISAVGRDRRRGFGLIDHDESERGYVGKSSASFFKGKSVKSRVEVVF